jgi:uncharacterized protein YxjI
MASLLYGGSASLQAQSLATPLPVAPLAQAEPSLSVPPRLEPVRYLMAADLFSLNDRFVIKDDRGRPTFYVDGRLLSIDNKMVFSDTKGNELATLENKIFDIVNTIQIKRDGRVVAEVRPAIATLFVKAYMIDVVGEGEVVAKGNFIDREYEFKTRGSNRLIANVSRKLVAVKKTYEVEIQPIRRSQTTKDDVLVLAATVAIDMLEQKR